MIHRIVLAAAVVLALASCSSQPDPVVPAVPPGSAAPSIQPEPEEPEPGDPQTLDGATEAAQAWWDRRGAGDYVTTWATLSAESQALISQPDYVAYFKACDKRRAKTGGVRVSELRWRINVTDPRWVGTGKTRVTTTITNLTNPMDPPITETIRYTDGRWTYAPSSGLRKVAAGLKKRGLKSTVARECSAN